MNAVIGRFHSYLARKDTYGAVFAGKTGGELIAYFSAEFGFHESIPNYSGGLGILSGDHCKSASDLGLNFVAVGLLYRHGYFRQQVNRDGVAGSGAAQPEFLPSAGHRRRSARMASR